MVRWQWFDGSNGSMPRGSNLSPLSAHRKVVPRNKAGLLRTWPLLIVILRISSTHFLQRVRVKNSKSGAVLFSLPTSIIKSGAARARARLFSRLRNFAGGLAKVSLSEAIRFR